MVTFGDVGHAEKTIRAGSYFERSKLPLKKLILLVYCWAYDIPQHAQAKLCGVSYRVTIPWNVYFRDVTTEWLKQNPIQLGGKGVICQIGQLHYVILAFSFAEKSFAAAEDAGHVERNDDRSEARLSCSEDHARPTLRSSTKTVFPAKFQLVIMIKIMKIYDI